jgi:hypothetical protein
MSAVIEAALKVLLVVYYYKGLIALNIQVAMALIEVNQDKELSRKCVAESWI